MPSGIRAGRRPGPHSARATDNGLPFPRAARSTRGERAFVDLFGAQTEHRSDFGRVWAAAEQGNDWYRCGAASTCRWRHAPSYARRDGPRNRRPVTMTGAGAARVDRGELRAAELLALRVRYAPISLFDMRHHSVNGRPCTISDQQSSAGHPLRWIGSRGFAGYPNA